MRAGRDEAVDIFRKWLAEQTLIRVEGKFQAFSFGLWGRVLAVTPTELRILSKRTESAELVLRLTPDLEFGYGDSRMANEQKQLSEGIVVFFRSPEMTTPDTIALAAFKTS